MISNFFSIKLFQSQTSYRVIRFTSPKCNMSCRKNWPPNSCKSVDCNQSKSCEKTSPRPSNPCKKSDPCRPPNLCRPQSGEFWNNSNSCNSSDPRKLSCNQSQKCKSPNYCQEFDRTPTYPDKPWISSRPTTWSPTSCAASSSQASNSYKPIDRCGKPSCPPPNKITCPQKSCNTNCTSSDACKPSDPCKQSHGKCGQSPPDPCKPPYSQDPCKAPNLHDPCLKSPTKPNLCSSTCPPNMNPNIFNQQVFKNQENSCYAESYPFCYDKEAELKGKFWRAFFLFVLVPVLFVSTGAILNCVEEEYKQPRPEYVPFEYMYRRTKRFPWGDGNHTIFYNPEKNAVPPDGYEMEDPYAVATTEKNDE